MAQDIEGHDLEVYLARGQCFVTGERDPLGAHCEKKKKKKKKERKGCGCYEVGALSEVVGVDKRWGAVRAAGKK